MPFPIPIRGLFAIVLGCLAAALGPDLAAEEAAVQVYECRQGGQVTFSGTPCAGRERSVEVDYSRPDAAQGQEAAAAAQAAEYQAGTVAQAALLDTEVLNLEQRITNLETERDARVSALRNQLAQGTEETDVDAWAAAMNQQILSVYNGYSDTLVADRARLAQLRAQREALAGPPPGFGSQ